MQTATDAYKLLHDGIQALAKVEQAGLRIDVEYIKNKKKEITREINALEKQFLKTTFFKDWLKSSKEVNIYSPTQLGKFLYTTKNLKVFKQTVTGKGATDEEALRQLRIPELDTLLQIKKLKKIRDTYLESFEREQVNGTLHPFYQLHLVKTFRGSSDSPNFQNIPKRDKEAMDICRKAIYPRPGNQLVEFDYKQLEVRIAACVVGNTRIETIDGHQSIKRIISRLSKNEKVYVYGYDIDKKRIAVSQITSGGITGIKKEVWKVTLDNGKHIIATPEHKFLLRNGEYLQLKDLEVGQSLMPFYERKYKSSYKTVYKKIYLNNGESILTHNLIAEDVLNTKIKGSNKVVHHWNGNGCDNSLQNIEVMTRKKHMKIHSIQGWINYKKNGGSRTKNNPLKTSEGMLKMKQSIKEWRNSLSDKEKQEWRKHISEGLHRAKSNIGTNNGMYGKKHTEESKEKNRISHLGKSIGTTWNKGLNKETNESVLKISLANKGKIAYNKGKKGLYKTSEETKQKLSIIGKGKIFSSDTRKKLSEKKKQYWDNWRKEKLYNHKVISIDFYGYEDVYNINVDNIHNYATSAGVIIKNCYNGDQKLIDDIVSGDMHRDVCIELFKIENFNKEELTHSTLRSATKNGFVFPQFYGSYYKNCAVNLACTWGQLPKNGRWKKGQGIPFEDTYLANHLIEKGFTSLDKFTEHVRDIEKDFWEVRYGVYTKWKRDWWQLYQQKGYIETKTGFRLQGVMNQNDVINYPIQGSAFHCLLWSLIEGVKAQTKEHWDSRIVGQIHDSIIMDVNPRELKKVIKVMRCIMCNDIRQKWEWITVPLDVDVEIHPVDGSWADKLKN